MQTILHRNRSLMTLETFMTLSLLEDGTLVYFRLRLFWGPRLQILSGLEVFRGYISSLLDFEILIYFRLRVFSVYFRFRVIFTPETLRTGL